MIELERAVTHAEFGSLKSGTTYVSVREVFGPPDLLSDNRKGRRIIARYGDIEFRFQTARCTP